jgi:alpha-ribazole phosphatase
MMPLLDLIRHGEPETRGLLLGRTDIALSEAGWRQFEQQTAGHTWASVVASPLRRAREPAESFARRRELPFRIDADWAEMDFGKWDGRSLPELRADPVISMQLDAFYRGPETTGAPDGEDWSSFRARVGRALHRLLDAPAEGAVLIATHAGPIRATLSLACDIPLERTWAFRIDYGTRLRMRVERQNDRRLWAEIIEVVQP